MRYLESENDLVSKFVRLLYVQTALVVHGFDYSRKYLHVFISSVDDALRVTIFYLTHCVAIVTHKWFLRIRYTLVVPPMDEMLYGKLLPIGHILIIVEVFDKSKILFS